jgi:hypothetical protein
VVAGRLDGAQRIARVRVRRGIESNGFGTLDLRWLEDSRRCCHRRTAA